MEIPKVSAGGLLWAIARARHDAVMRGSEEKIRWTVVVATALLCGAIFFLLVTLTSRYILGDDLDWGALGPAIGLAIVLIGIGAAQRQGWFPAPRDRRNQGR